MEETILNILNNQINNIPKSIINNDEKDEIIYTKNLDNSITFSTYKNILLKITYQKTQQYVEIKKLDNISIDYLQSVFSKVIYKNKDNYIKIYINDISEINKLEKEIQKIYIFLSNNIQVEPFGCCSRYIQCSDMLKCTNPDKKITKGCQYKENLENGKIFYGKNKNIYEDRTMPTQITFTNNTNELKTNMNKTKSPSNNIRTHKGKSLISFPNDYVIVDIETTGLDTEFNEIIEISALKIVNNVIIDEYSKLVKPQSRIYINIDDNTTDYIVENGKKFQLIDGFISSLTGITNKMLENEKNIYEVLPSFIDFIGNNIIIGHNINFDINFLYDNLLKSHNQFLENDFIDTLRISRKILPELKHHRLDDLIKYFNIEKRNEHRALNDCKLTYVIFEKLKELIINQYNDFESFENEFRKNKITRKRKEPSLKAKDIQVTVDEIDTDNPFYEKVCVFTGVLAKMPRREAMQIVVNLGGICADSVTSKTNFLILGNNDYCATIKDGKSTKQKKAENLKLNGQDIEILSENVFYEMLENDD